MEGGEVMKVKSIKKRVETKVAKAKSKVARKCGKAAKAVIAIACLSVLLTGCMGTTTPSRSQTMTIKDCTINVYGCGTETNEVARVELATQAMSIENSGTETQTSSPTQTTDVKPDVNVNYAQGGGITNRGTGGSKASGVAAILESLTAEGLAALSDYVIGKKTGTVTLQKKDGSTVTADCKDGSCTFSDGTVVTAADCESCTDK